MYFEFWTMSTGCYTVDFNTMLIDHLMNQITIVLLTQAFDYIFEVL